VRTIDSEITTARHIRLGSIALPRWLLLTLVAVLARAVTFGNPVLHVDEQFYYAVADAMRHGAVPFVDVWDRKPVGLFLVYLPAVLLGPVFGIWAYQAMALVCVVVTAEIIARLAERADWTRGALVAAILYILWLNIADGQGGQSPVFYNPLVAAAILLAVPRRGEAYRPRAAGLAAMALIGLSLQIKYSTLFEGIWIGLFLLWCEWRAARPIISILAYGGALVFVALLPTLAVAGVYAAMGQEQAFLYANFISVMLRRPDSWQESGGNFVLLALSVAPLMAAAWVGRQIGGDDMSRRGTRLFLRGWLVAALVGVLVFGSWFNHYALPLLVPGCVCAAAWFGNSARGISWAGRWRSSSDWQAKGSSSTISTNAAPTRSCARLPRRSAADRDASTSSPATPRSIRRRGAVPRRPISSPAISTASASRARSASIRLPRCAVSSPAGPRWW
jgi:hypothetical protein